MAEGWNAEEDMEEVVEEKGSKKDTEEDDKFFEDFVAEATTREEAIELLNKCGMGALKLCSVVKNSTNEAAYLKLAYALREFCCTVGNGGTDSIAGLVASCKSVCTDKTSIAQMEAAMACERPLIMDAIHAGKVIAMNTCNRFNLARLVWENCTGANYKWVGSEGAEDLLIVHHKYEFKMKRGPDELVVFEKEETLPERVREALGVKWKYVTSGSPYTDYMLLMLFMTHDVKVSNGKFVIRVYPFGATIPASVENFYNRIIAMLKAVIVTPLLKVMSVGMVGQGSDVLSLVMTAMSYDHERIKKDYKAMTASAVKAKVWANMLTKVFYNLSDPDNIDVKKAGVDTEQTKFANTGVFSPAFVDTARSARGGDKSVANTYLKDWNYLCPGLQISTYAKWRQVLEMFDETQIKTTVQIGCTSADDWWSKCTIGEVARFDIKPTSGIEKYDVTSTEEVPGGDLIMSDAYLDSSAIKDTKGSACSRDFAANREVFPSLVRNGIGKGKCFAVKVFPMFVGKEPSFEHLRFDMPKDWVWTIVMSGRMHNAEAIFIAGGRSMFKKGVHMRGAANFTPVVRTYYAKYVMALVRRANVERNTRLSTCNPHIFRCVFDKFDLLPRALPRTPENPDSNFGEKAGTIFLDEFDTDDPSPSSSSG